MNINNNTIKITLLIVSMALSQFLSAQVDSGATSIDELPPDSLNKADNKINLVFEEKSKARSTGSINYIDAESELMRDSRLGIGSAINGKVPGVFDSYNIWGTGNAVVVVDGVRQDGFYYGSLNLMEVESIVVLKDAVSKALYGAQGDQGIVLINTKRGIVGTQKIRVSGEYSLSQPRTLPDYLSSADYMDKYNEAQLNDGVDIASLKFSQESIDGSRLGADRTRYPDNDFYTDEYLRNLRSDVSVFADVTGGEENAQYYVSTEWGQSNGWLSTGNVDKTNRFNFRGNLDFKINPYIKMGVDASARLDLYGGPHMNFGPGEYDYWSKVANILPNSYPVLWDPSIIADPATRDMVLDEANLIDGKVLGGSSSFANNQIRGDLSQNGQIRYQERNVQFGGKMDIDLSFITKGLTAKAYGGMNFYNSLFTQQNYEYAIYEPIYNDSTSLYDTVNIHGVDRPSNQYNTNSGNSDSYRRISYYGNLGYVRNFGKHDVSAVTVIYGDQLTFKDIFQKDILFHTGLSANYMYNKRYVAEVSAIGIGTRKLAKGNRMELAPSFGLAWIVSEEAFMDNLSFLNYLKLRASYGISKNDDWYDHFLYMNTFVQGSNFHYYNNTHYNAETLYSSVSNDISLQKREDISVGLDASMFNNTLNVELGYFSSTSLDNITLRFSTYPQLLGYEDLIYNNFNSYRTQGIELGINYTYKVSEDFSATVGGNLLNITPKITKYEEPVYEGADIALQREGTAWDAMWMLVADGLYGEGDFNTDGTLANGLPEPTFGAVQAGDIKYLDQNGDGIIDQNDQRIVGNGIRTQYSAYLDLRFKNLGFYILGIGRFGDSNYRSGSYFRVFGDIKYSEYAMQAYGPGNKDVNASHPRLSTNSGGHNDRNSSYWVYENNSFRLPTMQLTYHFKGKNKMSFLKPSRVYVRAGNMVILGKNKKYTEVNPFGAPSTRNIVMGLVTSF
ncbi:SusC/RagA family TonB-linked outer membrane protein [Bacteroidota bacterium]